MCQTCKVQIECNDQRQFVIYWCQRTNRWSTNIQAQHIFKSQFCIVIAGFFSLLLNIRAMPEEAWLAQYFSSDVNQLIYFLFFFPFDKLVIKPFKWTRYLYLPWYIPILQNWPFDEEPTYSVYTNAHIDKIILHEFTRPSTIFTPKLSYRGWFGLVILYAVLPTLQTIDISIIFTSNEKANGKITGIHGEKYMHDPLFCILEVFKMFSTFSKFFHVSKFSIKRP